MNTTITPMKAWLQAATPTERETLAKNAGTSAQYIAHLAVNDDKLYKREPKPALAAAIERETKALAKSSKGRLPIVWRTDLVTACRQCAFAQKCLGDVATRSHFSIVVTSEPSDGEGSDTD